MLIECWGGGDKGIAGGRGAQWRLKFIKCREQKAYYTGSGELGFSLGQTPARPVAPTSPITPLAAGASSKNAGYSLYPDAARSIVG